MGGHAPQETIHVNGEDRLLIFGASTRAAAQSAVRAGFRPICADRFSDEDLFETAEVMPLDRYPNGLMEVAAKSPSVPWIYTGALENRPALLQSLRKLRPLLGNPAEVVRRVRNPLRLNQVLRCGGQPALEVRPRRSPPPADGKWLVKPRHGSGGRAIRVWDRSTPLAVVGREPCYFQRRMEGQPISALFLSTASETVLVGASEQWIGVEELFAGAFAYCGSIGPLLLPEQPLTQIRHVGEVVGREFGLQGLFGIDFVLNEGVAWPTEVNPRYTASVEIYELALGLPLLGWHRRACLCAAGNPVLEGIGDEFRLVIEAAQTHRSGRIAAKAVVYAPFSLTVPDLAILPRSPSFAAASVTIADRPKAGSFVPEKAPVCTLLTSQAGTIRQAGPTGISVLGPAIAELVTQFERKGHPTT